MPRLYHPDLGRECEVPNDRAAAVLAESGWLPAPEPEVTPGLVPEPVRYAPVTPSKSKSKASTKPEPAEVGREGDDH